MAMWFCGLSAITSASRAVFSLARDRGTPAAGWLRGVHPSHGTPGPAIWVIAFASLAAMVWTKAIPVVTSLSTVALYVAYIVPVVLGLKARLAGSSWPREAPWSLGRWGVLVNAIAIGYTVVICVILVMPPNQLAGLTFLGLTAVLLVLYLADARRKFKGPHWSATAG
jgi:amino acid transporter